MSRPTPRDEAVEASPLLRSAWKQMLEQSQEIADEITASILDRDAGTSWSTPKLKAVLRQSMREHVRRGLTRLAGEPAEEKGQLVEVLRATGIERARQGIPLEAVLSAYTAGNLLLWEELAARVRTGRLTLPADELVSVGQTLWHDLEIQSKLVSEAYRREIARQDLQDRRRQENYLAGLLEGRGSVPEFAARSEEILGIHPEEPVVCVVAIVEDTYNDPLHHPEDRIERLGGTSRWGMREDALYGIISFQGLDEERLTEALRPAVRGRVGLSLARDGIAGTAAAFRLAGRVAATLPADEPRLVWAASHLPELLLESSPDLSGMIVDHVLGPVLKLPVPQRSTLMQTLRALLRHDGSPTYAAEELFCHRNTVIYRSRQLTELTERDMQQPRDRLLLQLALIAHDLAVSAGRSPA
ncbi:CdaR family transcriptional regulator [Nesterenkonia sp.]|uniref:PucR family transcriptional regulator n=1 Tax=Nesterenkonia sp. TaxID=704201 RepID=UPI0026280982|nr:PucR family transcriptional regulator [Nesterenkonia sp.]